MSSESSLKAKPRRLIEWLEKNYKKSSRKGYKVSLKNWLRCHYGEDSVTNYTHYYYISRDKELVNRKVIQRINEIEDGLERYFSELDGRDFTDDFKTFLRWTRDKGYAPLYIRMMISKVKVFFARQDPRCKISDEDWSQMKRTLMPKSMRAATQDDILTKEELIKILQHISTRGKAMALFLLSTGVRIGAACQLKMEDINLDLDPPEINVRGKYTKGEVGGRLVWITYEARDAIREWHEARLLINKYGILEPYDENLVFNLNKHSFNKMWNRSLKKADGGRKPAVLAKRDLSTKSRIHIYHVHTLRKFFGTNMRLAGVPVPVVHGWMGHQEYLSESYDRLGKRRMAELYKDNMNIVTVQEFTLNDKVMLIHEEAVKRADELVKEKSEIMLLVELVGKELGIKGNLEGTDTLKEILAQSVAIKRGKSEKNDAP